MIEDLRELGADLILVQDVLVVNGIENTREIPRRFEIIASREADAERVELGDVLASDRSYDAAVETPGKNAPTGTSLIRRFWTASSMVALTAKAKASGSA